MPTFAVESYKVRLEILRSGSPVVTHRNHIIELASAPLFHGIVEQAMLVFSTYFDSWSGTPAVGYYDISNALQPRLTGWFPSADYALWYDIVRSEKPLTLFYNIAPIGGANYVDTISLGTSTEPIGEGPEDVSP